MHLVAHSETDKAENEAQEMTPMIRQAVESNMAHVKKHRERH
jgi:hypothetical protein